MRGCAYCSSLVSQSFYGVVRRKKLWKRVALYLWRRASEPSGHEDGDDEVAAALVGR